VTRISRALLALAFVTGISSVPIGCSGGVVGGECRSGFGVCHGYCLDFRVDSDNCGACGNACPAPDACVDSVCLVGTDAGAGGARSGGTGGAKPSSGGAGGAGGLMAAAGGGGGINAGGTSGAGGTSLVDAGDASAGGPGAGGGVGSGGTGGTGGTPDGSVDSGAGGFDGGPNCVPPYDTPENCGNCGVRCAAPTPLCSPGNDRYVCTGLCTAPLVQCGDQCVNTDTDENNCGSCGRVCASGICQGAQCVGATAGHEVIFCMDFRTQPAVGSSQQRLLGNSIFLATANPVRVLAFSEYAPGAVVTEVNKTLDAAALARGRTYVLTPALTSLDVTNNLSVVNYDVLLVYDQSNAPAGVLSAIGSGWSGTVDSFVRAGGTMVVLASDLGRAEMVDFLSASGLMTATGQTSITGAQVYNRAPGDAVGINALSSFRAARETCTFAMSAPDASSSFVVTDTPSSDGTLGAPVVVHRVLAP
jgi:hypothetical protein